MMSVTMSQMLKMDRLQRAKMMFRVRWVRYYVKGGKA